jgi:hypothetical protein
MSSIRITEHNMTTQLENLDECHLKMWNEMKSNLEKIDVQQALSERSKSLKIEIERLFSQTTVIWKKQSVFSSESFIDVPSGLQLDARGTCSGKCNSFHQLNIVLCLNNREIIGTNFLKLEVSAKEEIRNHRTIPIYDSNVLGILVTFDDSILTAGNWDPAYANSNEYIFAFERGYRGLMKSNIIAMQLHLV